MKRFLAFLPLVAFLALSACAEDEVYDDDVYEEDELLEDEGVFEETSYYGTWDLDDDTYLNRDEYRTGYMSTGAFTRYDVDQDGYLSEDEWATTGLFADDDFTAWDTDNDELLSETEYYDGSYGLLRSGQRQPPDRNRIRAARRHDRDVNLLLEPHAGSAQT